MRLPGWKREKREPRLSIYRRGQWAATNAVFKRYKRIGLRWLLVGPDTMVHYRTLQDCVGHVIREENQEAAFPSCRHHLSRRVPREGNPNQGDTAEEVQ